MPEATTAPHSDLDLTMLIHWSQGYRNTKNEKYRWTDANKNIAPETWNRIKLIHPTEEHVRQLWETHGVTHVKNPVLVDDLLPSPGRWFYTALLLPGQIPENYGTLEGSPIPEFHEPKVAYHGTSIMNARCILSAGKIKTGVCITGTGEKIGVYCERAERKSSCMTYATHVLTEHGLLAAAVFELAVDKSYGTSINRQWVIPEDKVIITGVFTHLLPWTDLYAKGYLGWYVVHESAYKDVKQIDNADWWHPETSDID